MKKLLFLGAALLLSATANCNSSGSKSKYDGEAGVGGEATGQPSAMGGEASGDPSAMGGEQAAGAGARPRPTAGGGAAGGGDDAGQGGEAPDSSGTFSIEGTVYAPAGGEVEGTVVIGCAWLDGGCDDAKSQAIQIGESGASGPYALENLEAGPTYLVLFWKDMNDSGEVDDDDYVGVVADESGAARAFTSAAADADGIMAVQQEVAATAVPAELVGDWFAVSASVGATSEWRFAADGNASSAFTLNSAFCGGGAGTAINSQGVIAVDGDELTFSPASGQKTVKPCSGSSTTTDYFMNVRHLRWRVAASSTQAGTALYLTDLQDPDQIEAEFQKL